MSACAQELCANWSGDGNVCPCAAFDIPRPVIDEDEEDECGYSYDHDEDITYEDDETIQWVCRNCGAEGWEDKDEEEET